jgi:hypothetical protein
MLNILVGDMSLIGPRPLLPRDQPKNIEIRLMVRPGITGWAQVNGGLLLTPDEKEVLDEWYIRNASLWLDLRIIFMTAVIMFLRGDRRPQPVVQANWTNVVQINADNPAGQALRGPPRWRGAFITARNTLRLRPCVPGLSEATRATDRTRDSDLQ